MLPLNFKGKEAAMTRQTFPATEESVPDVITFVDAELEKAGCPMKTQTTICVAIEELFVDIAHYAYPDVAGSSEHTVAIDKVSRIATFVISNASVPFNPPEKQNPDITKPTEEREIGGLCIFIVKKTWIQSAMPACRTKTD